MEWLGTVRPALFTKPLSTVLLAVGTTPLTASWHFQELYQVKLGTVLPAAFSAIHKAGGFMVYGRFTGLPGMIPVNRKVVLYGSRPYGGFVNSAVCSFVNTAQGWGFSQRS